jgi:hypothetical protein
MGSQEWATGRQTNRGIRREPSEHARDVRLRCDTLNDGGNTSFRLVRGDPSGSVETRVFVEHPDLIAKGQ